MAKQRRPQPKTSQDASHSPVRLKPARRVRSQRGASPQALRTAAAARAAIDLLRGRGAVRAWPRGACSGTITTAPGPSSNRCSGNTRRKRSCTSACGCISTSAGARRRRAKPRRRRSTSGSTPATLAANGGRYDEAITHLRLVRDEDPDNDHALYMLAVAHAQRGEHAEAIAHLERAIALNPENRSARRGTIPTSSRCAQTTRSAERSTRRRPPASRPPPPAPDPNRAIIRSRTCLTSTSSSLRRARARA